MDSTAIRTAPGDPAMQPLARLAPTLAAHNALDCGLVRIGRGGWLVFYGGMLQAETPFATRTAAVLHLMHLDRLNDPATHAARRVVDAEQAALRG